METEVNKQEFSIQPRNHFVIVKATTNITTSSFMILSTTGKIQNPDQKVKFEVVAIGKKVEDLNIGDIVVITGNPDSKITIEGNSNSQESLIDLYKDIFKDNKEYRELIKHTPTLDIVEYLLYPEYSIAAIKK